MEIELAADLLFIVIIIIVAGSLVYKPLSKHFSFWKEIRWRPVSWGSVFVHYKWAFRTIVRHSWLLYIPLVLALISWFYQAVGLKQTIQFLESVKGSGYPDDLTLSSPFHDLFRTLSDLLYQTQSFYGIGWPGVLHSVAIFFLFLYYVAYIFNVRGLRRCLHYDHRKARWVRLIHVAGILVTPLYYSTHYLFFRSFFMSDHSMESGVVFSWISNDFVSLSVGTPIAVWFMLVVLSYFKTLKSDERFSTVLHSSYSYYLDLWGWYLVLYFLSYIYPDFYKFYWMASPFSGPLNHFFSTVAQVAEYAGGVFMPFVYLIFAFVPVCIILQGRNMLSGAKSGVLLGLHNLAGYAQFILLSLLAVVFLSVGSTLLEKLVQSQPASRIAWIAGIGNIVIVGALSLFLQIIIGLALFSFWWSNRETVKS